MDGEGAAINLYNIRSGRSVKGAPVKGQCARDYFYGEDLKLERALQRLEAEYARIIRLVESAPGSINSDDLNTLRDFAYLQFSRTEMAMRRKREMMEAGHDMIYDGRNVPKPVLDISDRKIILSSMLMYLDTRMYVSDLKSCVIKNESRSQFVTSDDPAIMANRFAAQRLRTDSFGLKSSGVLLFLPLTPCLMLMSYDGNVYTLPDKAGGFLRIRDDADVLALNELQYLKAAENIYFRSWEQRDHIEQKFRAASPRRPLAWFDLYMFVPDGTLVQDGANAVVEKYRRATDEERATARETLMVQRNHYPIPSSWLSKLKYRRPVRAYYNGSAVGHVRKEEWLTSQR